MEGLIRDRIMKKDFLMSVLMMFLLEIFFGIVILIKGGNLDSYLGIILPEFIVILVFCGYTAILKTAKPFVFSCVILFQIGSAMQCIIQKESERLTLKQDMIFLISLAIAIVVVILHIKVFCKLESKTLLRLVAALTVLAYLFLLIFGRRVYGAKAWVFIGPFSLQITEFIKILWVYFNAVIFSSDEYSDRETLIYGAAYMFLNLIGSLLIGEMGSLLIMILVFGMFCIVFIDSNKLIAGLCGLAVIVSGIFLAIGKLILKIGEGKDSLWGPFGKIYYICDRIATRITIWRHPEIDPLNAGYQGIRAKQAIALGGLFGSKHRITLPVAESDFIFPSIIMNLGIIVAILVVILFLVILVYGIKMYIDTWGDFETAIIAGCVFYIFVQSMIMILGSTGFFVMTGVPISFISDGGSAMMVTFIMTALIVTLSSGNMLDDMMWGGGSGGGFKPKKNGKKIKRDKDDKKEEKEIYREL